jgi:hypothetical protein
MREGWAPHIQSQLRRAGDVADLAMEVALG